MIRKKYKTQIVENQNLGSESSKQDSLYKRILSAPAFLFNTPLPRFVIALFAMSAAVIASAFFVDSIVLYFRLSVLPLFAWIVLLVGLFVKRPSYILTKTKLLAASFLVVIASMGVLGIFDASYLMLGEAGKPLGGEIGYTIAMYPQFNTSVLIGKALLFLAFVVTIVYPKIIMKLYKFFNYIFIGILLILSIFQKIVSRNSTVKNQQNANTDQQFTDLRYTSYTDSSTGFDYNRYDSQLQTEEPIPPTGVPISNYSRLDTISPTDTDSNVPVTPSQKVNTTPSYSGDQGFNTELYLERLRQHRSPKLYSNNQVNLPSSDVDSVGNSSNTTELSKSPPPYTQNPDGRLSSQRPQQSLPDLPTSDQRYGGVTHSGSSFLPSSNPSDVSQNSIAEDDTTNSVFIVQDNSNYLDNMYLPTYPNGTQTYDQKPREQLKTPNTHSASVDNKKMSEVLRNTASDRHSNNVWSLPEFGVLQEATPTNITENEVARTIDIIESCLMEHGIPVTVDNVFPGPTVTKYGLTPGWRKGPRNTSRVRVDDILSREKDLILALAQPAVRFENVVPGESMVGLEVPNPSRTLVTLRSVIGTRQWLEFEKKASLPIPLGLSSKGVPEFTDLATMPHMLVAGATGSGKSAFVNAIICGLLLTRSPHQVRFVLIDPKLVELTYYTGIPHLYTDVITEPSKALLSLRALVAEMEKRLHMLKEAGARNIGVYNLKASIPMPYIVLIVDELADLMIVARGEVEPALIRLAQLARATGIHMVLATQRPSVNVVTGDIKVNFPTRICFSVTSITDSRTILDTGGGEKLLGKGDMLYLHSGAPKPERIQGAFVSEDEVQSITKHWHVQPPVPLPQLNIEPSLNQNDKNQHTDEENDLLFQKAVDMTVGRKTVSVTAFQTHLSIGFPKAYRLMKKLEEAGIVGPGEPGKPRKVIS